MEVTATPPAHAFSDMEMRGDLVAFCKSHGPGKRAAIIHHLNPDGDALGSSLGLAHFLQSLGMEVLVISPNTCPEYLKWLPGFDTVLDASMLPAEIGMALAGADIVYTLDFGMKDRMGNVQQWLGSLKAQLINIDHHVDAEPFTPFAYRDVKASSTCELVHRWITHYWPKQTLPQPAAMCLYTGLVTDTGSFRYSLSKDVHTVAAQLLAAGADAELLNLELNNANSLNKLQFLGYCLAHQLTVYPEHKMAIITVTEALRKKYDVTKGDMEGLVNYALSIKGMRLGVFLREEDGIVRMSFRSIGKYPANAVAGRFGGGGHLNAAGGRSTDSLELTISRLLQIMPDFASYLP